ncbi:competence type IV pilus major pilin ComGC [Desulfosporosinus shakirovi]|uniref:competence type IV pilus major pilin ComGC n=1 Tax=Desulfosporosinus shakirovi TaxID=2885154 RepID=UPI001E4BFF35|nr:prepilin-type N-terminal cleavage/methylation domain-containing protein [Desulfosporosinus sp. SRJS8]MCB8817986.1 type II secretion system protein [Desulfosporosinus sp. SRJS8]
MNKLNEMIKRRKDNGFTLIELMIVIAVIGILAVVLVPKVGTIKTQAKTTGLDTNIRLVEGYVQSKITKWADKSTSEADIQDDIVAAFEDQEITNPFTFSKNVTDSVSEEAALIVQRTSDTNRRTKEGAVVVEVDDSDLLTIRITAHDNNGDIIDDLSVDITP